MTGNERGDDVHNDEDKIQEVIQNKKNVTLRTHRKMNIILLIYRLDVTSKVIETTSVY